jgi:hypothetical protein
VACTSKRGTHWALIVRRTVRVSGLRATFERKTAPVRRTTVRGRVAYVVTINMRGLRRGIYVARVRYRITARGVTRRNTRIQYFRACYSKGDSPNRWTTTIL